MLFNCYMMIVWYYGSTYSRCAEWRRTSIWMNAFPFGIMNLPKTNLGIKTRTISEVGGVTVTSGVI